ncbi:fasciclin domain-containing protein [Stakelama marina]|uniref:Fasciclin domain-containing protein n=1 Tax=Stakelama marina TaxID=2826939 RepID=A0A8T4IG62_9SPHN|nr:fasciclin domain-containing protein [Stakelama marina]MBR0553978.1 fasciclin domain-containing protein [Stakelama marina]
MATLAGAAALAACASTASTSGETSTASTSASSSETIAANPTPAPTPEPVMVGGAAMLPSKTIVENASAASNLTTLVSAVKAAGLVSTLSGPGPFTVFAPDNGAFSRLPPGTIDTLMKPENKAVLAKILKYHVVAGKLDSDAIKAKIKAGGGTAMLTTVEGEALKATLGPNGNIKLSNQAGTTVGYIDTADVMQSNGVVHVINGVMIPNLDAGASASGSASTDTDDSGM